MGSRLGHLVRRWTELGRRDPLGAALTYPNRSGGHWDTTEFLDTGRQEIDRVVALLARRGVVPTMGTALDFGCGPGRLAAGLAAAGFARVIGVDVSPTMLARARELVTDERCEFARIDGPKLVDIPDGSVDLVYSCRVLQHMPPVLTQSYVEEFHRVVAPGGLVVFQVPSEPARNAAGAVVRLLPDQMVNPLRRGMEMHGIPTAAITRLVAGAGGVTISIEEDSSAGRRWRSHLYITRAKG